MFALNTATFLLFGVVALFWRPEGQVAPQRPEHFGSAIRAGGRYVRHSPVVRRILIRTTLFLIPGSALWALLPLVASRRLSLGAGGYGLMLGALGIGAIAGAFLFSRITSRLPGNALVAASSVVYAAVLVAIALLRNPVISFIVLVPAGVAWIAVLSSMNTAMQLFLPAWVRARGLSIYLTVFFGAQAIGSVIWGAVADVIGVVPTFLVAAALMLAGAGASRLWPLIDTVGMDRRLAPAWPEPRLVVDPEVLAGPVVVQITYTIAPQKEQAFLRAMTRVRQSRLRTGADQWGIFRDAEKEHVFVEMFVIASWDEHMRQHSARQTGTDKEFEDEAIAYSDTPPRTSHYTYANIED